MKTAFSITAAIAVGLVGYVLWSGADRTSSSQDTEVALADGALVDIVLPETLSTDAQIGKRGFEASCAACHGTNAVGQVGVAPPLIHVIYEPGHHGDESFQRAVDMGVRGHHWPYGNMPPIKGLTDGDVTMIIAYIRELQQANGID